MAAPTTENLELADIHPSNASEPEHVVHNSMVLADARHKSHDSTQSDDCTNQMLSNDNRTDIYRLNYKSTKEPAKHALSDDANITFNISFLFILVGLGPSWLLGDGMFIQIPYWQRIQPEGLTLANKMTISGIMPLVTVVPIYFIIVNNINYTRLSFRKLSYFLIGTQIISCIIIAIGWPLTIGNVSITIHFITFIASFVGHMMLFAIVPWITSINHKLSAPILTGTNLGTLCTAMVGLIQQPGADPALFSPTIFYLIWIFVFLLSLAAFVYLDVKYLRDIEIVLQKHNRIKNQVKLLKQRERANHSKYPKLAMVLSSFSLPIWWKKIWKFAVLNAYIQLITWVFIRSTIPFAVRNASPESEGENTQIEQYAIELSYVAVLLGSALSIFIGIKQNKYFWYLIGIYSIFALIFLFISVDDDGLWVFWGSSGFVVVLVFLMRFIDGYISPLIYQNIARDYPNKAHEMNQWLSATAAIAAFIGVWITYLLVQSHAI
eukprot:529390_1